MIKKAITKSYETSLTGNTFNFSEKEIRSLAENASSQTIDSIVENTVYIPVSNSEINQEELMNSIADVTSIGLANIEATGDEKAFENKIRQTTVKAVYPLIESNKLNIRYDYFWDLVLFTSLSIVALLFAFLLKMEDKKKGYGLEKPNIEK